MKGLHLKEEGKLANNSALRTYGDVKHLLLLLPPELRLVPVGAAPGVPVEGTREVDVPVVSVPGCEVKGDAPDPPAAVDSCANPTDGGLLRNTEYTFFYIRRVQ